MAASNYFKVAGEVFFFDEREPASVLFAFSAARDAQEAKIAASRPNTYPDPICVWQRIRLAGPWDFCREVGESERVVLEEPKWS